jgi:hypothetical protein
MEQLKELPIGVQTFEEIVRDDLLYVDKTSFIEEMISRHGTKAWFLSRPRRFGKSLTVSTLKALFSGRRELFKGRAIERRLDEKIFAPRPVIMLDMSRVSTAAGVNAFRNSLVDFTYEVSESLNFEIQPGLDSPAVLWRLITRCAADSGRRVAVLVDEYDKPYLDFMQKPEEAEEVRATMRDYYAQLKAADEHISFIFITGVSKFSRMGVFSALNNVNDVSIDEKYGAMCGYTHEELAGRFGAHLKEAA